MLLKNQVPRADEIAIDGRVVMFAVLLSIVTGVVAGTIVGYPLARIHPV